MEVRITVAVCYSTLVYAGQYSADSQHLLPSNCHSLASASRTLTVYKIRIISRKFLFTGTSICKITFFERQ
jgi:hypothetical protein